MACTYSLPSAYTYSFYILFCYSHLMEIIIECGFGAGNKPRRLSTIILIDMHRSVDHKRAHTWWHTHIKWHIFFSLRVLFVSFCFIFNNHHIDRLDLALKQERDGNYTASTFSIYLHTFFRAVEMQCVQFTVADIVFNVRRKKKKWKKKQNANAPTSNCSNRSLVHISYYAQLSTTMCAMCKCINIYN